MELQEKQILNPKELTTIQPGDLEIPNHSTVSGFCGNQSWKKSFCWQIPSLPTLISIHKIGNLQIVPEQDIFQTSKDCKSCPSQKLEVITFWTTVGNPWGSCLSVCLFATSYPHHQFSKGRVCLFVFLCLMFYPHHQFNRAECHRREEGRWEHPKTVFWPANPV